MSVLGIIALISIALLFCENRKAINIRSVGIAFVFQVGLAALVLYIPFGQQVLATFSSGVQSVIGYADVGIVFLFGDLGRKNLGFIFAVNVLPVIIFFSALVAVLYHLGLMQKLVYAVGGIFKKSMGTSHAESLSATANIFVSQTEAPLIIRPFIAKMTSSELFAVMVGGMASIAGSLLVGYANMGVELKYLIASSFMAAPGGLMMAKLIKPETQTPEMAGDHGSYDEGDKTANVIDAAATGALSGLRLAVNIGAMLIAFIALIALLNDAISGIFSLLGVQDITIELLLGYLLSPVAFLLGIPAEDVVVAGGLIGQKVVLNEFVAYANFVELKQTLAPHSQIVITFALCGFANFSSIAILLGGLGGIAPTRRSEIAQMGLKALLAATLANLMSAALASFFTSL